MKPGASNNDIIKMKKLHRQGYDAERISKAMRIELSCVKSHLGLDKARLGIEGTDADDLPPIQDEDAIPADLRPEVAAAEEQLEDAEGQL